MFCLNNTMLTLHPLQYKVVKCDLLFGKNSKFMLDFFSFSIHTEYSKKTLIIQGLRRAGDVLVASLYLSWVGIM